MSERRWTLAEIEVAFTQFCGGDAAASAEWAWLAARLCALPEPSLPPETGKHDLPFERGNGEFEEDAVRVFASQLMNAHYEECFIGGARWQFERMKK